MGPRPAPALGPSQGPRVGIEKEISNRLWREPAAWTAKRGQSERGVRAWGSGRRGVEGPGCLGRAQFAGTDPPTRCIMGGEICADKPFCLRQDVIIIIIF